MRALCLLLIVLGFAPAKGVEARQASARLAAFEAAQWRDPDLGRSIRKGFADADVIWLLGQSGRVVRFDRRSGERTILADKVIDILPVGPRLWALSNSEEDGETLQDLRAEGSVPLQVNAAGGSAPLELNAPGQVIALFPAIADRPGILTTRAVLLPSGDGRWLGRRLAGVLAGGNAVTSDGNDGVYVGANLGEWGGGLRRIDLATGSIAFVTQPSDELCGGLINPECDPVVGAFPDPDHAGCILTGVGLAHLSLRRGAVLRVCGSTITPVFSAPMPRGTDPFVSGDWPFYSLVQTRDGWIAVSDGRYFQLRAGEVAEHPLPPLRDWSGLRLGEAPDGALFVMSACCWGVIDNPTDFSVRAIPTLE